MSFRSILIAVGILLIVPCAVKAEGVSATSSVPVADESDSVTLHLDSGFVGRAARFDLFNGSATVSWDAKTLVAPTALVVFRSRGGVIGEGESAAGRGIVIRFENANAVSERGTMLFSLKADRPPSKTERVAVKVFLPSLVATSTSIAAAFGGTTIRFSVNAAADFSAVPAYGSGIMREGLASWYRYKGCLCAASPDVPKGTRLKVSRQDDPSRFVIVTVNDYGPDRTKHPERAIDLDRVAFAKIGNPRGGVLAVKVEIRE